MNLEQIQFPERFLNADPEFVFDCDDELKRQIKLWIDDWKKDPLSYPKEGLYLYGNISTCEKLFASVIHFVAESRNVICTPTAELLDFVSKNTDLTEMEALRRLYSVPLLALYDFGMEYRNDYVESQIAKILRNRFNHQKPTVILSYLLPEYLEAQKYSFLIRETINRGFILIGLGL